MPYVEVNGERLFYAEYRGAAKPPSPPLVLVHGAGGTHLHWPPQVRRLEGHIVYALDLPGHGRSGGKGRMSVPAYRDVVLAWADALGLAHFVLAGHSMGGAIAQEFALTFPNRLAGIVLVATGARLRVHPQILQGLQQAPEETIRMIAEWAYGENPSDQMLRLYVRRMLEIPATVTYGDFAACNVWDRMADIGNISVPTLVIGGEADRLTPPKYARYLHEHIPHSRLVMVPRAGHMVMLEAPDVVAREIATFVRSLTARRRDRTPPVTQSLE